MRVPLINTVPPPEFGALQEAPQFLDPAGQDRDYTYVPGFSELRRARDRAIAALARGVGKASDIPEMPCNMRWARCQNKKGDPDTRKAVSHGNRGYAAVTKDDIGPGKLIESLPAGAFAAADGTIRQGDTMLMVASKEAAARNEWRKRLKTEQTMRGAEEGFRAAAAQLGVPLKGADPSIIKEHPTHVRATLDATSKKAG